MSLKSQTRDPQLKVPPCAQDFYVLKKSIDLSRGLNPRILDLEAITLPQVHRGRLVVVVIVVVVEEEV